MITAKPIADSAAATVKIKKENIWPKISSKYNENKIKFKFKLNKTNSTHIKIIKIFRRLKIIPNKPIIIKKKFETICRINIT